MNSSTHPKGLKRAVIAAAPLVLMLAAGLGPAGCLAASRDDESADVHDSRVTNDVIHVNQVGYLPKGAKTASFSHSSTSPRPFKVLDSSGSEVATGQSKVFGQDPRSGENVHLIDFSGLTRAGKGYTIRVEGATSAPFDIRSTLYASLKYDALAYFYYNRASVEIKMPYAKQAKYARAAGHLPDIGHCVADSGCDYTLDVSRGWYDAGDQGKYVVNGGIAVWTMMNEYERALHIGTSAADLGDGKLGIPESGNGVPDILDEARWELEFILAMQVPEGKPLAGMAHHKMHDDGWTGLPTLPSNDHKLRVLRPVSTAATLNLAAVAAQGARVWKAFDPSFSARCLAAAERAYAAAKANPVRLAPATDGNGGGAYEDDSVTDELYWAATELFITTGKQVYRDAMSASPHDKALLGASGEDSAMAWPQVDALGAISLAIVPSMAGSGGAKAARDKLVSIADRYLQVLDGEGYRVPFRPSGSARLYPWGSNASVLNNMIVLALASDFTGDARYLGGVTAGMDYLLGRNPMNKSYVSGYGVHALQNPHHRFWSHQLDANLPSPPPGAISGGPNSSVQDPVAAPLKGCAAQKCYVDDIGAYSVNEVAINWNSPLAWIAAWLDEKAMAAGPDDGSTTSSTTSSTTVTSSGSSGGSDGSGGAGGGGPQPPAPVDFKFSVSQNVNPYWVQVTVKAPPGRTVKHVSAQAGSSVFELTFQSWGDWTISPPGGIPKGTKVVFKADDDAGEVGTFTSQPWPG